MDIFGGSYPKGVNRMVYDMLDKTWGEEYHVEDCIKLAASRFSSLHTT